MAIALELKIRCFGEDECRAEGVRNTLEMYDFEILREEEQFNTTIIQTHITHVKDDELPNLIEEIREWREAFTEFRVYGLLSARSITDVLPWMLTLGNTSGEFQPLNH